MPITPSQPDEHDVPPRLADDLAGIYGEAPHVPPSVDRSILTTARDEIVRRRARHIRWAGLSAVAAGVAILVGVSVWTIRKSSPAPGRPAIAVRAEDVNADGVVDIRDALRLANHLRAAGGAPATDAGRDVTGDGVVDRRDVDAIAMAAVRLPTEDVR